MLRRPSRLVLVPAVLALAVPTAGVAWQSVDRAAMEQRAKDRQEAADTRREIEDLRAELDRLDHARLVVRPLHTDNRGLVVTRQRPRDSGGIDDAIDIDRQPQHPSLAAGFHVLQHFTTGGVLDQRRRHQRRALALD